MVAIMKGPRAKKFNKFKKRNNKHKPGHAKPEPEPPRELPKNDMEAKVHLITQDIKFAQALGGNDKRVRDKFLKNLKKWLNTRSKTSFPFTDQDFLRLWKGLFYCMWMSDKPLVQEQLCEDMGSLFYCFDNPAIAVQFYGRFLETVCSEWLGIDHWRLDKFMMLVRRVSRHLFTVLNRNQWAPELLKALRKEITGTVLKEGTLSFGSTMHFLGLYWEEVAKVSEGKITSKAVTGLIRPFLAFLTDTKDQRLSKRVVVDIFYGLLKQSDLGRQHEEKYEVWKQFGFPSERISDIELVEDEANENEEVTDEAAEDDELLDGEEEDEEEIDEKLALDPRAGNVSVVLPEIPFNARKIHQLMEKAIYDAGTRSANRKVIKKIMANYEKFIGNKYPLGIQRVNLPSTEARKMPNIMDKVQELDDLESEVLEESRLMKTLTKAEKKKFYQSGMSQIEYLASLGKHIGGKDAATTNDDTNGMEVEDESDVAEIKKNKKKRKAATSESVEVGDKKNKKVKISPQDTSVDLDNGFEVEEEATKEKKPVPVVEKKEEKPKAVVEAKSSSKKANGGGSVFEETSEWDKPLVDGEVEYFVTPTKQRLKHLNGDLEDRPVATKPIELVKNPFANGSAVAAKKQKKQNALSVPGAVASPKTPVNKASALDQLRTPNSSGKRVKIMLEKNMAQEKSEYFRQLRNSPQIPFDSTKRPAKGLLKPHSMPSPINPYYKKKIGLKLDNEE